MDRQEVAEVMEDVFEKCRVFRESGQKEYSHREGNAFANFERVAERIGIDRKACLMVYAEKHLDGVHSYIKGHKSQREDVRGRILDIIVYMVLLYAMIEEEAGHLDSLPKTNVVGGGTNIKVS